MKDVQFWICFQTEGSLTEPLTEGYIAVPYSCPLKGQPATPLDFFYLTLVPSKSCWTPLGCWLQFPTPLSHHKCFKLHFSSYLLWGERDKSRLLADAVWQAFLIVFHTLLILRSGPKQWKGRITFIPSVKVQPSEISQQLTASIRHTCTPVPPTAYLKTGSRNKQIPVFHYRTYNHLNHTTHRLTYFSSQAFSYSSKLPDGNKSVRKHMTPLCSTECPILVLILILTGHTWFTAVQIKIN